VRRTVLVATLALDLVGAAGALLIALRSWQTITTPRSAPFHDDVLDVSGRTVDSAPTAFALVALAGVVAMLATRGTARRIVGVVLVLAGAGIAWRALASSAAVGVGRARTLVTQNHQTVDALSVTPHVTTHSVWPWLTVLCGLAVVVSGVLAAWSGHRWPSLSSRYERAGADDTDMTLAPDSASSDEDEQRERSKAATTLWNALDRGDDPTR
jgi:uncharacterized membrane protein (TIGR02234 family)